MFEYRHGMRYLNSLGSCVVGVIGTGTNHISAKNDAIEQLNNMLEVKRLSNPDTIGLFLDASNVTVTELEALQIDWRQS